MILRCLYPGFTALFLDLINFLISSSHNFILFIIMFVISYTASLSCACSFFKLYRLAFQIRFCFLHMEFITLHWLIFISINFVIQFMVRKKSPYKKFWCMKKMTAFVKTGHLKIDHILWLEKTMQWNKWTLVELQYPLYSPKCEWNWMSKMSMLKCQKCQQILL